LKRKVYFLIYCRHKVKKGKNLKTMWQNNVVLCRVTLLGPKPTPKSLLGGVATIFFGKKSPKGDTKKWLATRPLEKRALDFRNFA
jgi:hypothetical protein